MAALTTVTDMGGAEVSSGLVEVHRAADRYRIEQPGIRSWHSFSTGPYYDPTNLGFGPLVAVDEHLVEPGAGFDWHAHRGVEIVTWVLDGLLRHEGSSGEVAVLAPGRVLHQSAADGIRHSELNASATHRLQFIQMALRGVVAEPGHTVDSLPLAIGFARLSVVTGAVEVTAAGSHLHVTRGAFDATSLSGTASIALGVGDTLRAREPIHLTGTGQALLWQW